MHGPTLICCLNCDNGAFLRRTLMHPPLPQAHIPSVFSAATHSPRPPLSAKNIDKATFPEIFAFLYIICYLLYFCNPYFAGSIYSLASHR